MKATKLAVKISIVLTVLGISCLTSCQKGEWCIDCKYWCSGTPLGGSTRTFCAVSQAEVEAEVDQWFSNRLIPRCWECGKAYQK